MCPSLRNRNEIKSSMGIPSRLKLPVCATPLPGPRAERIINIVCELITGNNLPFSFEAVCGWNTEWSSPLPMSRGYDSVVSAVCFV